MAAGVIMGAVPLLTDAISALVARQADLSVEIVEDTSAALLAQLDAGRLDGQANFLYRQQQLSKGSLSASTWSAASIAVFARATTEKM